MAPLRASNSFNPALLLCFPSFVEDPFQNFGPRVQVSGGLMRGSRVFRVWGLWNAFGRGGLVVRVRVYSIVYSFGFFRRGHVWCCL